MRLIHDNPSAIQQPRHSRIPELIDYDGILPKPKKAQVVAKKYVTKHPRVVDRVRMNYVDVKPGRVLLDSEDKSIPSVSPFDAKFPVVKASPVSNFIWSVSPWSSDWPMKLHKLPAAKKTILPSEESEEPSVSPFSDAFPRFAKNRKRLSKNRGQRKRRQLALAMNQYKKEHGPVALRTWETKAVKSDPNVKSYSPWQELEFAELCQIPLRQYFKVGVYRELRREREEARAKRIANAYKSYTPWDSRFPFISHESPKITEMRASYTTLVNEYKRASASGTTFVKPHAFYPTPSGTAPILATDSRISSIPSTPRGSKPSAAAIPKTIVSKEASPPGLSLIPSAALKAAILTKQAKDIVLPKKGGKSVVDASESPKASPKQQASMAVAAAKVGYKSPTAPLQAVAFPAISPVNKKQKNQKRRSSLQQETEILAAPYIDRFVMGVL